MDLKIQDVAELLSISEETVLHWLLEGKIPSYKLNDQHRFSRIEVENWMQQNPYFMGKHSKEETVLSGSQQFSLYRALNRGGVHHTIEGVNKKQVICNTLAIVAGQLHLDAGVLSELFLDREKLMSTGFNHGVAVPHARECIQHIPFDLVSVVFLKNPIDYGALDQQPVHTLFFLFATSDKTHLHLLAKIAHLSSHPQALDFFQTRPEKGSFMEFVREWEGKLSCHGT